MQHSRTWRRYFGTSLVLCCLSVGFIVNVGVAWWYAIDYQRKSAADLERLAGAEIGSDPSPRPSVSRRWPIAVPKGWPDRPDQVTLDVIWGYSERSASAIVRPEGGDFKFAVRYEYGWPLRSVCDWWYIAAPLKSPGTAGGFIHVPANKRWPWLYKLPWRPLWFGFMIDTIFFGTIVWALLQASIALRRWRRRGKGACVRCGYDLKGLTAGAACPECGAAATPS